MATILYFGWARDCAGIEREELDVVGQITLEDLWRELILLHPGLAECRSSSRVAVDMKYAGDGVRISPSAEVAIIPPVAGG